LRRAGTVFGGWRLGLLLRPRRHDHRLRGGVVVVALLLVRHRERRVLLFGDAHVVAGVALLHDVPRTRVQQDGVLVELGQLGGTHPHQGHPVPAVNGKRRVSLPEADREREGRRQIYLLSVRVKAGVGEALALVLPEEAAVPEDDVVDLVAGAPPVQPVPLLLRLLSFSTSKKLFENTKRLSKKEITSVFEKNPKFHFPNGILSNLRQNTLQLLSECRQ
jgi:hypothetical protein